MKLMKEEITIQIPYQSAPQEADTGRKRIDQK